MRKLIISIFLVFISCTLFKKEEEILPLTVDNWWAYQVTEEEKMFEGLRNSIFKRLSRSPATYIDTMKIVGKQTIQGVDGYVAFSSYDRDTIGIFYYKNDYLWLYHPGEDTFTEKVFPEKPKIGDNWIGYEMKMEEDDWDGDDINDSIWIKAEYAIITKENINVLAGNFKDCYRTQMSIIGKVWFSTTGEWQTIITLAGNIWIKSGVGLIKQDITGYMSQELMAYKVK